MRSRPPRSTRAGKDAGFSVIGDLNFAYQHPWQAEAWYYHRGGLDMLREAYARFNVYPVGVSWWGVEALVSKKPLKTTDDFKGLKVRTPAGHVRRDHQQAGVVGHRGARR